MRCIIMFLLAAPLGCIIKKGGFGMSVLISCIFYINGIYSFHIWKGVG